MYFGKMEKKSVNWDKKRLFLLERRDKRPYIYNKGGDMALKFVVGDVLVISFKHKGITYLFEGICILLRNKNFKNPDVSFILRNVVLGVGVELSISYFFTRLFFLRINDYKRKRFFYKRAKLLFLRKALNKASLVLR